MVRSPDLIDSALAYLLRYGWTVIPTAGKRSTVRWQRFQTQRPTERDVRRWFSNGRADGIAVILGSASGGLACRDYDDADGYQHWAGRHPDLAGLVPTVRTARGFHVYCRTGTENYADLGDGEFRGDSRHYVLLPPSRHPSGVLYQWVIPFGGEVPVLDPIAAGFLPGLPPNPHPPCPEFSVLAESSGSSVSSVSSVSDDECEGEVEDAVLRTLPQRQGERARRLFDLARILRGMARYAGASGADLEPVVREWHRRARPVIGTKPLEESLIDFCKSWPKVKFPADAGPLDELMGLARAKPLPAVALRYEQAELRQLVALLAELQRVAGDKPFFLSCRSAARLLGVSHDTVARWLFLLVEQRVLKLVAKGDRSRRRASEFRYVA